MARTLRSLCLTSLAVASLSLAVIPAFADSIVLTLAQPKQTATAGSTVSFNATVFAPVSNSTFYDLSDNFDFNPSSAVLTINDDGFFNTFFPPDYNPGTTVSGLLFSVILPANLAPGAYTGFFEVYDFTADPITASVKSTATFEIDVPGSASPVPEPASWLLLFTGLTIGGAALYLNGKLNRSAAAIS